MAPCCGEKRFFPRSDNIVLVDPRNWYNGPWQVDAADPTALTRLLDLPGLCVTRLEYDDLQQGLLVFCEHVHQIALCPTCDQSSTAIHQYRKRTFSDLETGSVLTVLADRKNETLEAYLATWTKQQREAVTEVAMDLWEPYAQAVAACLPNAAIVADRFHVMEHLNDQVSGARRDLQRGLPEATKQTLKGCRWLLVRNAVDLSPADQAKLQQMFVVAPALGQLHALKEDFRAIFETETQREAARFRLEAWMTLVETSGLTKLTKFVGTLRRRIEHIFNYFSNRLTSGKVEGLNTKVKVIKRCAYGFRNFEHFALRIQVECDGAP